jgi:hypothetical protein
VMQERRLIFHLKDGTSKDYQWYASRSESWTEDMREQARIRRIKQMKGRVLNG